MMLGFSFDPDDDLREYLDMRKDDHCHVCGLSKVGKAKMEARGFKVNPCTFCVKDYET